MLSLLEKTRLLMRLLQDDFFKAIHFTELCCVLSELLSSEVFIFDDKGKVLGVSPSRLLQLEVDDFIGATININLSTINETRLNISSSDIKILQDRKNFYLSLVPIIFSGERLGCMLLAKQKEVFGENDMILAEYSAMVVGLQIINSHKQRQNEKGRKVTEVQQAIHVLSYSEKQAVAKILDQIEGNEALLVVSKIADDAGITRSAVVNALRKLESAGIIESSSLGMKGTLIRIINDKIIEEFKENK